MVAGKEDLMHFEALARRQHRIYNDAADYGVIITEEELVAARVHLKALLDIYNAKVSYWGDRKDGRSWGSTTTIFVPYEIDAGHYSGQWFEISYNHDTIRNKKFFVISIQWDMVPEDADIWRTACK